MLKEPAPVDGKGKEQADSVFQLWAEKVKNLFASMSHILWLL